MSYKLADGSSSDLYRVGDTFIYCPDGLLAFLIRFDSLAGDFDQFVVSPAKHIVHWEDLTPTGETKEKVKEREMLSTEEGARRVSNSASELADNVFMISKSLGLGLERSDIDKAAIDFKLSQLRVEQENKAREKKFANLQISEPLSKVVNWVGGERVEPLDFVVVKGRGADYRAVILEVLSEDEVRTCRGIIKKSQHNMAIIRINTSAIPR